MKYLNLMKKSLVPLSTISLFFSCVPKEEKDPVSAINGVVKEYGYIGFQNPVEDSRSGTMIGGKATALSYIAPPESCFSEEKLPRFVDEQFFTKTHSFTYQGNFGFLSQGTPILSAAFGMNKSMTVNIEITNMKMEYMSSIDITDWYHNGMNETCHQYLDKVGFIAQALSTEKMTISITQTGGLNVGFDSGNINQYFKFEAGVQWQIIDSYHVEITTPKYIGYQLGSLRSEDSGLSLYRASSVDDDNNFVFEAVDVFGDLGQTNGVPKMSSGDVSAVDTSMKRLRRKDNIGRNSVFK